MRSLTLQTDADGIALIVCDMPGRAVNVLSADAVDDFERAVERVLTDGAIRGAVVTSAKSAFIAGTDPVWLEHLMRDGADAPARARAHLRRADAACSFCCGGSRRRVNLSPPRSTAVR